LSFKKEEKQKKAASKTINFGVNTSLQHRLTANSGHSAEKCYFRDQETNNKADKFESLLHATCVKQDRCKTFFYEKLYI
jgi:hypothetical protein